MESIQQGIHIVIVVLNKYFFLQKKTHLTRDCNPASFSVRSDPITSDRIRPVIFTFRFKMNCL